MKLYSVKDIQTLCENVYQKFHKPEYINPDPLQVVKKFSNPVDQEFSAFVCAVFALGRVELILNHLNYLFSVFPQPTQMLQDLQHSEITSMLKGHKYRFFSTGDIATLLYALSRVQKQYGTLEQCFLNGGNHSEKFSVLDGLENIRKSVILQSPDPLPPITIPNPQGTCKRLHLFLRWVVRNDEIDLGLWKNTDPSKLSYPLDTHMFRFARFVGITRRNSPDVKSLNEINDFFQSFSPQDPVRFDFSLTRLGLGKDLSDDNFGKILDQFSKI